MRRWIWMAVVFVALALGFLLGRRAPEPTISTEEITQAAQLWTCSMHPQIQLDAPGDCPICGMDLIPIAAGSTAGPATLHLSPSAAALAEIVTAKVERRSVDVEVRLVGRVAVDETRLRRITARVNGRLERLYVDYAGVEIHAGDHLVDIYSPELIGAQEELVQSKRGLEQLQGGSELARRSAEQALDFAREKLRLLGMDAAQIDALEGGAAPSERVTFRAPMDGVVLSKDAIEGSYVETGASIYTIADLSWLWVLLDAYESDLRWLRYGQRVEFSAEALPGRSFTGTISFIDPIVDERTRTARVRVQLENPRGELKPGMFVRAVLHARAQGIGQVAVDPKLAGKWISPMHPEIIKDGPGTCDVCGMALVPIESMGYAKSKGSQTPLVIPATAPLLTGTRAIVYVAREEQGEWVYEGREVHLGPRAGDFYLVESGLSEGEQVVVNGAFKIDSQLQIQAQQSMMSSDSDRE